MKTKAVLIALGAIISISGIIRHDIPENEYLEYAKESQFDCAGRLIRLKDNKGVGSCVLISPNHVLLAAHCLVIADTKNSFGSRYADISEWGFVFGDKVYRGKKIFAHPAYDLTGGEYDLAVIELETEVKGVTPATLNLKPDELDAVVTGVGYGASGIANKPETVESFGKKIAGQNTIDSIGGYIVQGTDHPAILYADFDHPHDISCNILGKAEPLPLEYAPTGGDSGSGLFRKEGMVWTLVGICAGGPGVNVERLLKTGYYGQSMGWTRTAVFAAWIKEQVQK